MLNSRRNQFALKKTTRIFRILTNVLLEEIFQSFVRHITSQPPLGERGLATVGVPSVKSAIVVTIVRTGALKAAAGIVEKHVLAILMRITAKVTETGA